jgi:hypothetical protein
MLGTAKRYIVSLIASGFYHACPAMTQWQTVQPGLEYTKLAANTPLGHGALHAFRIDLHRYRFDLALAVQQQRPHASIQQFVTTHQALIGINGGFFNPNFQPLGLRIKDGEQQSPARPISWWGIFYIAQGQPAIVSLKQFQGKHASLAIQSGPRLLIHGQIPHLKPGVDDRSALCITSSGRLILIVTDNAPLTTTALAEVIGQDEKANGLGCRDALNLDGGSSTQLYARLNHFVLDVPGYGEVADALLVFPKTK